MPRCAGPARPRARRRRTYHSGIRCGHPRGPMVAQVTVRSSARNAATSASDILICSRRLTRERVSAVQTLRRDKPPKAAASIPTPRQAPYAATNPQGRGEHPYAATGSSSISSGA